MFSPDSNLRLLNVRFDSELRSTLWFPDRDTQTSWFLSQSDNVIFNDITYVKKDNAIVLGCREEDVWRFNYVMYQNSNFSSKWFYAFIVKREWASDYSVKFYLQTDPIQTWMFDWSLMTSFIERQHSTTDSVGDNEVPEPFSTATAKFNKSGEVDLTPNIVVVFGTTDPSGTITNSASLNNGIVSGAGVRFTLNVNSQMDLLNDYLSDYVDNGIAPAVCKIQQIPGNAESAHTYSYPKYPSSLSGYVPRNNKLLSGLFNKLEVAMYGQRIVVDPRLVNGNSFQFVLGSDWAGGSIFVYGSNVGAASSGEVSMVAAIPESSWAYNQFKNYVNLHSQSNGIELARAYATRDYQRQVQDIKEITTPLSNILTTAAQAASLNISGALQSTIDVPELSAGLQYQSSILDNGIDEISQKLARYGEDYYAPATGNIATSNGFIATGATNLEYGYLSPPENVAKVYDDFLTVYGYAQNTYSIPNLHARKSWTYVKVTELMLDGNCPDEDEVRIKAAFRNGIFFWVYDREYGNFNQDNGVL